MPPTVSARQDDNPVRFVAAIPLKPRSACADWDLAQANLRRTIRSVQRSGAGHATTIAVACHDEPDLALGDAANVHVLRVPFAQPHSHWEGGRDKARKRRFIGAWLRDTLAEADPLIYVMFLDADDLVHEDLVTRVVAGRSGSYLVDEGYILGMDSGLLTRRRSGFSQTCGSSFICSFARDELPQSWNDLEAPYSRFGSSPEQRGHPEYPLAAAELGRPAALVPFAGVVYTVNHGENLWTEKWGRRRSVHHAREIVLPGIARRTLAERFAAPDLAEQLADLPVVSQVILRTSIARARARLSNAVTPPRARRTSRRLPSVPLSRRNRSEPRND